MDYSVDSPALASSSNSLLDKQKDKDGDKEKGKLKEPRVGRACDRCRRAKIRCLDGMPDHPCARCKAAAIPCTFEEKPVKRGPPKGYVESLERRLEAMEALLRSLSATSGSELDKLGSLGDGGGIDAGGTSDWDSPGGSTASNLTPLGSVRSPGAGGDTVDRLAADLEELSVDKDRYVGRGSGLHLARSIREFSRTDIEIPSTAVADEETPSIVELLLQDDHHHTSFHFELPPEDLATALVDAYFTHQNAMTGLLHRPSFERAIEAGELEHNTSFRSLFFMVCAVGARFVKDERLDIQYATPDPLASRQSRGFEYFRASSGSASPALMSAALYDIQSSVLAILWLLGAATPISAWACVGFAIRRVVDVGAHRETRIRWNSSPLEDQLRRRAFHALFGIDRTISGSLGRPLAIHDEDTDLGDPLDISDEDLDEWNARGPQFPPPATTTPGPIAGFTCMLHLQRIMGRALRLLYGMNRQSNTSVKATEAVCELDSLLNQWLNQIPEHLKWNPLMEDTQALAQSACLYCSYYCCQILVHRDFISPTRSQLHAFPSLAICSNAARSCSHVLDVVRQRGITQDCFGFVPLAAVTSGLILLINVFANPEGTALTSSAMSDVRKCIAILEELAPTTFLAHKCAVGLSRLVQMAVGPLKTRDPSLPSLKRPNDWDEGESPTSSGSQPSTHPSPSSCVAPGDEPTPAGYKQTRKRENHHRSSSKMVLPLTTDDLSLLTFNGRPTFAPADPAWAASPSHLHPQHVPFAPQLPPNAPAFPPQPQAQAQATFPQHQAAMGYADLAASGAWNQQQPVLGAMHQQRAPPSPLPPDFQFDAFGTHHETQQQQQYGPSQGQGMYVDPNQGFTPGVLPAFGVGPGGQEDGFEWPQGWDSFDFDSMMPLMTGAGLGSR